MNWPPPPWDSTRAFTRCWPSPWARALPAPAGTLFATQLSAVSPNAFDFAISVTFFAIVVVGGQASIPGVLLGTVLMFIVPEVFRQLANYRYLFFGIAMIGVMILRPQGIWPRSQGA